MGGCYSDISSLISLSSKEIDEYEKKHKKFIIYCMLSEYNSLSSLPDISK